MNYFSSEPVDIYLFIFSNFCEFPPNPHHTVKRLLNIKSCTAGSSLIFSFLHIKYVVYFQRFVWYLLCSEKKDIPKHQLLQKLSNETEKHMIFAKKKWRWHPTSLCGCSLEIDPKSTLPVLPEEKRDRTPRNKWRSRF